MSFEAMKWASQTKAGGSTNKLVLLLLANYADQDFKCFPSIARLAEMTECSPDTVRRAVHDLRKRGIIEIRERFEAFGDKKRQTSNVYVLKHGGLHDASTPPSENATPPLAETEGHITNHNNQSIYTSEFLEFWDAYPSRPNASKKASFKKWQTAIRQTAPQDIIKAAGKYALSVRNTDPQYIAHATTWLNQERYIDIMNEPAPKANLNRIVG